MVTNTLRIAKPRDACAHRRVRHDPCETVSAQHQVIPWADRNVDDIDFICLGGQYHRTYNAYIGIVCENAISRLRANLLICSASAIS